MPSTLRAMLRHVARYYISNAAPVRQFSSGIKPPPTYHPFPPTRAPTRNKLPFRRNEDSEAQHKQGPTPAHAAHRHRAGAPGYGERAAPRTILSRPTTGYRTHEDQFVQFCQNAQTAARKSDLPTIMSFVAQSMERRKRQPPLSPQAQALERETMLLLARNATTPAHLPSLTVTNATMLLHQLLFLRMDRDPCTAALENFLTSRLAECRYHHVLVNLVRLQADAPTPNVEFMVDVGHYLAADFANQMLSREISILFRGFGKVGQQHPALFAVLKDRLLGGRIATQLASQGLSNCLWAFARLSLRDGELIEALVGQALALGLDSFVSQGIANTTWALATLGHSDERFLHAVVTHLCATGLHNFKPQEMSNTIWAFATLGHRDETLLRLFAQCLADRGLHGFKPQELANTTWALATLGYLDKAVMQEVIDHFLLLGPQAFKPQELSNVLWAFATLEHDPGRLADAVMWQVQQSNLAQFKPLELSNLLWAVGTLGLNAEKMLEVVGRYVATCDLQTFTFYELAITVWAYATSGHLHRPMMQSVSHHLAQRKLDGIQPQGIANLMWAFAMLLPTDMTPVRHLMEHVAARGLDGFVDQGISNIVWACAVAGFVDDAFFASLLPSIVDIVNRSPNKRVFTQLHQFLVYCELHATRLPRTCALIDQQPDLIFRCADVFERCSNRFIVSQLQDEVFSALQHLGLSVLKEVVLKDAGMYSADILLEGTKTVVEVDGPWHFLRCGDAWVPSGSTLLKRSQLAGFGYTCIPIPFYEWKDASRKGGAAAYLQCLLPQLQHSPQPRWSQTSRRKRRAPRFSATQQAFVTANVLTAPEPS